MAETSPSPIVLFAVEGLCARLSTVLSFRLVALAENRDLLVVWTPDSACEGHFLDIFLPLEGVTFIESEEADRIPQEHHIVGSIDFHDCIRHDGGREANCFAALSPRPDIQDAVAANLRALGPDAAAIHVRRTDHFAQTCSRALATTDTEFDQFLDAPAHCGRLVYVATDNQATQARFVGKYSERVRCSSSLIQQRNVQQPLPLRHSSLRAAVVDLLTCASCRVFKGSAYSSFSDVISLVRRSKGVAHLLDEHEPSALWQLQRAPSVFGLLERIGAWWPSEALPSMTACTEVLESVSVAARIESPEVRPCCGPLCSRCSALLLGAVRRSRAEPSSLEAALSHASSMAEELRKRPLRICAHEAAARWLRSDVVRDVVEQLRDAAEADQRRALERLDRMCRALFACGCVGAAEPVHLHRLLSEHRQLSIPRASELSELGTCIVAATLAALWAHAHRNFAPVVAALTACDVGPSDPTWKSKQRTQDQKRERDVAAVPISDGEGCEPDSQLDVWRRERLSALRDGRGSRMRSSVLAHGPYSALLDGNGVGDDDRAPDARGTSGVGSDVREVQSDACLRCWRCLKPTLCGGQRCAACIALYCSAACEQQDRSSHVAICALVQQATASCNASEGRLPNGGMSQTLRLNGHARRCLVAETYYAWRSGCPGWRSTHLDRRQSTWEEASAGPLWDALPFMAQEDTKQLFGPMYGSFEEEEG